jgi:hypothetical protein
MSAIPPKGDNAPTQCPGLPSAATPFEDRRRSVINHAINRGVSWVISHRPTDAHSIVNHLVK